ncbi:MAG: hypothetical protein HRT65_10140 [Flavobacteriaceae bacterium]|nr:hypothetical protein [Flavobacteriaceae bacterium]
MYLSLVVDGATHHSAHGHLNKADVFNVSVTRARHGQYVYHSGDPKDFSPGSLLRKFLVYGKEQSVSKPHAQGLERDFFLKQIQTHLPKEAIVQFWEGYRIADITLDLLIQTEKGYYAIDLIGYPGDFVHALSVERIRILNRAQIKVFPLSFADWYFDQEGVLTQLRSFLYS